MKSGKTKHEMAVGPRWSKIDRLPKDLSRES